jgi:hypothetical protein
MKKKTYFRFRVDIWDARGDNIIEHVAGIDDFEVAEATYRAAVARWPARRASPYGKGSESCTPPTPRSGEGDGSRSLCVFSIGTRNPRLGSHKAQTQFALQ